MRLFLIAFSRAEEEEEEEDQVSWKAGWLAGWLERDGNDPLISALIFARAIIIRFEKVEIFYPHQKRRRKRGLKMWNIL
jgi:hypothetical protein